MKLLLELRQRLAELKFESCALALENTGKLQQGLGARKSVLIEDCGEGLVEIGDELFTSALAKFDPHPYQSVGAPYGKYSPFSLRESVLLRLLKAQQNLSAQRPGARLKLFDGFRPVAVQAYMVNYELNRLASAKGCNFMKLDEAAKHDLLKEVYTVWAEPDTDPTCPPPHSTGAAVDLTIIDENQNELEMGGTIDAIGAVSLPNYFAASTVLEERAYHDNRILLEQVMSAAGFRRLPWEWWHFSYGDQVWALLEWLDGKAAKPKAVYGRV